MGRSIPDTERSLAFGGIGAAFAVLGTAITNNWQTLWIQNLTDATLEFTWDGSANHNLTLPPNSSAAFDEATNVPTRLDAQPLISIGTQFQVRHDGGAPTLGAAKVNGEFINR